MSRLRILEPPPPGLLDALAAFSGPQPPAIEDGVLVSCHRGQSTLVLATPRPGATLDDVFAVLSGLDFGRLSHPGTYEIVVGILGEAAGSLTRRVISLGIAALPAHSALAHFIGLPPTWRRSQRDILERSLEPLRIDESIKIADLRALIGPRRESARGWLATYLDSWTAPADNTVYIEAEAGKGKSTILTEAGLRLMDKNSGPIPIYVPLRSLQRGVGVSWPDIAACVGVIGIAAEGIARAVRAGLVSLLLDGLDEIAGRYDPTIVKGVIDAVFTELRTDRARLVLSGRRTEASLLQPATCIQISLELPATSEAAFTDYTSLVVHSVTPAWPALYPRVPEPPLEIPTVSTAPPTPQQETAIIDWLTFVFDDLGKERSLFFVQSLACLARTYQLAGNRPLIIRSASGTRLARPSLYDVCILAAALACIREQDKIEDIAKPIFAPAGQLDLLTWLALRAAAPDTIRHELPNPNELTKDIFKIDPVNQNEEFTAIVRQVQKHALLFTTVDAAIRVGDWTPAFLSDWTKDALLCRAWKLRDAMAGQASSSLITDAVVGSQRASLAFRYLLPEVLSTDDSALGELAEHLRRGAAQGIPEACAHYWELRTGLAPDDVMKLGAPPHELVPLTDLSELEFEGVEFDRTFSGILAVAVGSSFSNCTFRGVRLDQCDFTNAEFIGCVFDSTEFSYCDGPMMFDGCTFRQTTIRTLRSGSPPASFFVDCVFEDDSVLRQDEPLHPSSPYAPAFRFQNCASESPSSQLLRGSSLGLDTSRVVGLTGLSAARQDPAVVALKALLKPFFPVRAGAIGQRQSRGYIRSSAIGRGSLPPGSPDSDELESVLRSVGFTSGGRQAHLYAPWSSVVGGGADAVALRNEMLAFLNSGAQPPRVVALLDRVRRLGRWNSEQ